MSTASDWEWEKTVSNWRDVIRSVLVMMVGVWGEGLGSWRSQCHSTWARERWYTSKARYKNVYVLSPHCIFPNFARGSNLIFENAFFRRDVYPLTRWIEADTRKINLATRGVGG